MGAVPTDTMLENRLPSHGTAELSDGRKDRPRRSARGGSPTSGDTSQTVSGPIVNRGETVVLHCFVFLLPVVTGPGTPAVSRR
jgi:hypothetical protein